MTIASASYPELLKEISDPPPLLYVRGNTQLLDTPQVAMVGSRRATSQGKKNAQRFARELAAAGLTITSGMALGNDAESHRGALSVDGKLSGVLGTGVDQIYPTRNGDLFRDIAKRGLLLSEFRLGSPPRPYCFPRRNRIISGMSLVCWWWRQPNKVGL